jgi:tRNA threonylcarbamoyladenosine biosynthesis protein TsaE
MHEETVITHSPAETMALAARLLREFSGRLVLALHGELGSGKTCFVQGLARALDIHHPVTSPTFTLVNEHAGTRDLVHIDLYRLSGPDEALALGFDEFVERFAVTAVEWAERARELFPPDSLDIAFAVLPDPACREIRIRYP